MNNKCLITGVAGFIGSALAHRLLEDGYRVLGVDRFSQFYDRKVKERNIEKISGNECFELIDGNINEIDLNRITSDIDFVFHLAAQPGVLGSWGENFVLYLEDNVLATQKLLEALKDKKIKKFIYASSSSVYGEQTRFPVSEDLLPAPYSPYGVTKLAGENLVNLYWQNYKLPVISLRFFSVYGPGQRPDMAFHKFIKAIFNGEEIEIYGNGEQTRDFTYVDDVVEANILALKTDIAGESFNIGGGSRISLKKSVSIIEKEMNINAKLKFIKRQKGDVTHTGADISKAEQKLGYKPLIKIEEGLYKEVNWLMNNFSYFYSQG